MKGERGKVKGKRLKAESSKGEGGEKGWEARKLGGWEALKIEVGKMRRWEGGRMTDEGRGKMDEKGERIKVKKKGVGQKGIRLKAGRLGG